MGLALIGIIICACFVGASVAVSFWLDGDS